MSDGRENVPTYIARKPCGCVVAAAVDDREHLGDLSKELARWVRVGLAIERTTVGWFREHGLDDCTHTPPSPEDRDAEQPDDYDDWHNFVMTAATEEIRSQAATLRLGQEITFSLPRNASRSAKEKWIKHHQAIVEEIRAAGWQVKVTNYTIAGPQLLISAPK